MFGDELIRLILSFGGDLGHSYDKEKETSDDHLMCLPTSPDMSGKESYHIFFSGLCMTTQGLRASPEILV